MQGELTRNFDERRLFMPPANAISEQNSPFAPLSPAVTFKRRHWRYSLAFLSVSKLLQVAGSAFTFDLERGNGFLFAPIFMAGGALAYFTMSQEPSFLLLLIFLGFVTFFAARMAERPALRALFLAAIMFSSGILAGKLETWLASTPMLGSQITTSLTGRVMRIEYQESGRVRLTLDVLATDRPTLRYAPTRVRASARSIPPGLVPGNVVKGVVRLLPPSGPVRPQSYDFAFKSFFSGIGASGFFMSRLETVDWDIPPDPQTRLAATVQEWRERMAAHIEGQIGGPEGAVAAALITGVRAGIPEEINEALRITGLYHVISISGLHMALVAGTLMVSLRAVFALFPAFSMYRPVKKYAAFCALVATGFYLIMSGGDVAAKRSFIMLAVMLLAILFDRAALTMRNLAISALIILVLAPHEVVGPSFQMSFAATAALIAAYGAWRDRRVRRPAKIRAKESSSARFLRSIRTYTLGLSMTSIVAGLATALFTAWHFQQVSPLSLIANLAAMPLVSVLVMPMAVLASLLMPFGLDSLPLWLMGQGIVGMNIIAIWLAERSAFDATGAIPLAAVLTLTAALALLTMSESMLRWLALPLAIGGVLLLFMRELPEAFISEDAALVALRLEDGSIAVNRARPRGFTIDNWQRAFSTKKTIQPVKYDHQSIERNTLSAGFLTAAKGRFVCADDLCLASRSDGAIIAHAKNRKAAMPACGLASLIVIADATAKNPCKDSLTSVITARQLARQGSVEIMFRHNMKTDNLETGSARPLQAVLNFSIAEPYRLWHEHRRYSREARGLAPYQRPQASAKQE